MDPAVTIGLLRLAPRWCMNHLTSLQVNNINVLLCTLTNQTSISTCAQLQTPFKQSDCFISCAISLNNTNTIWTLYICTNNNTVIWIIGVIYIGSLHLDAIQLELLKWFWALINSVSSLICQSASFSTLFIQWYNSFPQRVVIITPTTWFIAIPQKYVGRTPYV